ncbi:arginyltransferase [Vibrio sp. UCD-FRSSP16_10]|uniref:arginyltransferase n=1 Tax=unclassified Vibrio TaxID=2614977 RepID=UPI0007FF4818|nr:MULTISPECIES: arginyltransferase [unclassified Vibrio]OBT13923.1 arginyltransferase [Vibrio sp. UCD-FRSSP16_30]OBT22804.1 arginyltransferase [Vibrio sp. UCD-FRSSP16_10]
MNSELQQIQVGFTQNHPCSYLKDQQERVAVALDEELQSSQGYELLLANGFRRSGETIYRPYCESCNKCTAIRIDVEQFRASKSQKRLLNKAKHMHWEVTHDISAHWFELYRQYIEIRHFEGSMYPPNEMDFKKFIHSNTVPSGFLHIYEQEKLISIAVTDQLNDANSAFYTFYSPQHSLSLGTLSVLYQIQYTRSQGKKWLYLGYQIDECPAMNYKVRFDSHQKLVNQRWQG